MDEPGIREKGRISGQSAGIWGRMASEEREGAESSGDVTRTEDEMDLGSRRGEHSAVSV